MLLANLLKHAKSSKFACFVHIIPSMQDVPHTDGLTRFAATRRKAELHSIALQSRKILLAQQRHEWWQVLTSGLLGGCAYPVVSLDVVNGLMLGYLLSGLSEQALVWPVKISFADNMPLPETSLKPVEPKVMHWWLWKIHGLKPHSQDLDLEMLQDADLSSHEEILGVCGQFNSWYETANFIKKYTDNLRYVSGLHVSIIVRQQQSLNGISEGKWNGSWGPDSLEPEPEPIDIIKIIIESCPWFVHDSSMLRLMIVTLALCGVGSCYKHRLRLRVLRCGLKQQPGNTFWMSIQDFGDCFWHVRFEWS